MYVCMYFDPLPFHKLRVLYGYYSLTSIGKTKNYASERGLLNYLSKLAQERE